MESQCFLCFERINVIAERLASYHETLMDRCRLFCISFVHHVEYIFFSTFLHSLLLFCTRVAQRRMQKNRFANKNGIIPNCIDSIEHLNIISQENVHFLIIKTNKEEVKCFLHRMQQSELNGLVCMCLSEFACI